jgi:GTP-binding protein
VSQKLRNVCIIAHVDHGKTTLVDGLLRQAGTFQAHQALTERVMDSMDLERERGITIMAKNTAIRLGDTKVNIVDTPGHADFGGEVERILGMVDGALLLVDAAEGPLPQTRFVLQKALQKGLKVALIVNKVDRPECSDGLRIKEVVNAAFDLFLDLEANDEQADFPIIYSCSREGWATSNFDEIRDLVDKKKKGDFSPIFKLFLDYMVPPKVEQTDEFKMLVSNLSYSDFVGRLSIGRVSSGAIKKGQRLWRFGQKENGEALKEAFTCTKLLVYEGLKQTEVEEISSGEIAVISGTENFEIGDTVTNMENSVPIERIVVEKPTLAMIFSVNTSPFSGREGEAVQSRKLRDRLLKEVRHNVALKFEPTELPDQFRVLGRGELQFAILIEQMRREGSEFMVGKPIVLYKTGDAGERLEPMEKATLDFPESAAGDVTQMFQARKGLLTRYDMRTEAGTGQNRVRLEFEVPTRGLLGIRSRYLTITKGAGLFSSELTGYAPHKGDIPHRLTGCIISDRTGTTTDYAIAGLEDRGIFFVTPGTSVYEGMIVGEGNKDNEMNVNIVREKKLTNFRVAGGADVLVALQGIKRMSLEDCIEWIEEDEWIEVTPKSIRIRKKILAENQRGVRRSERMS